MIPPTSPTLEPQAMSTSTPGRQPSLSTPSGESISPNTLARHKLVQQEAVEPASASSSVDPSDLRGLKLNKSSFGKEWKELAVVETLQIPKWFEQQKNNYNVKQYNETTSVEFNWIDMPADESKDVRACRFTLQRRSTLSDKMWDKLIDEAAVVWRAQYNCACTCQRVPADEMQDTSVVLGAQGSDCNEAEDMAAPGTSKAVKPKGRGRSSTIDVTQCPVGLRMEVYANDLKHVHIWIRNSHKDAAENVLNWSRRVHLQAVNLSRNEGATAAQVMKSLVPLLKDKAGPNAHYAKNAFASLSIFAAKNPDRVFLYQAYEPANSKKLMCALTDDFCLGSALLYAGSNGLFMDATWRGMNQNYAPTTFLLAVDDKGHATPLCAFLSQDVQADTLEKFLKAWMGKVKSYSAQIMSGIQPVDWSPEEIAQIQKAANMVLNDTWNPGFMMIDKDCAERKATQKAFPKTPVQVCQFHAVQAILRWLHASHPYLLEKDSTKASKSKQTFTVPEEAHASILQLFRYMQRCRTAEEFPAYQKAFELGLKRVCDGHGVPKQYGAVSQYFKQNYWCAEWRGEIAGWFMFNKTLVILSPDAVTDIGLPAGYTRDKVLNTNNHAESFIKTFKHTILGMQQNKRVDTLVIVKDMPTYVGSKAVQSAWEHPELGREKAFTVKDLFCHEEMLPEEVVPLDDNFPIAVEQWEQAGNDLAMATYDDLLPVTDSSPTGTHQQPPQASPNTSSSNQNLEFTATPINTGGRPGKHLPIWPTRRRTYRKAVLAPPASQNSVPDPPSPQVLFRKFKAKPKPTTSRLVPAPTSHKTAVQDPVPARDSASIAAALNLEDYQLFHSNIEAWEDKWYQLRHDEVLVGTEMITQLARTLELGTYAIVDQGDSLKHFLDQAMFDPTCLLAQILTSSPAPGELQHVLILRLRNSHWMLVHFQLDDRIISTIDSLPQEHSHHPDLSELGDYVKLANILADTMNPHDVDWHMQPVSTAHQPVFPQSGMVANLSSSMSLGLVKQTLKSLLVDYKTNAAGGLSQDMVVACLSDLVPNIRVRFAHMEDLELWAPKVPEGPGDPTFQLVHKDAQMDTALSVVDSQGSHDHTDLWAPNALTRAEKNKLHKACRTSQNKQLKYKYGSAKVPHVHWLSLQQSHWISSGLLDFMCATTTSADDGLWYLSTAFMPQLKELYQQVSRLRPYGRVNKEPVSILGDVKCLFIPFNEPITGMKEMPSAADSDEHVTGSHWAALVVKPQQRQVVYKSSLLNMKAAGEAIKVDQFSQVDTMLTAGLKLIKVYLNGRSTHQKSDKGKYNEQLWSFGISESTLQQLNLFDCGAFVLSYMMECHLGQDLGWNNTQIGILRELLAVQILEGNSALSSLIEQTQPNNLAPPKLDAIMTPNCKQHQSQTPTTSPEAALKLNKPFFTRAIPKHAQRVKRLKMADFPVKAPALVHTAHTTKATSSTDLSHMERILAFKPMSTSSSPESGPKKDTDQLCPFCDWVVPEAFQTAFDIKKVCLFPSASHSFYVAKDFWMQHQRAYVVGAQGMHEAHAQIGLSYYGQDGNSIMFGIVRKALDEEVLKISWADWVPIDDTSYALHNVLIPELMYGLVMEDLGIDYEEAFGVVEESREFGQAGFTRLQND
ncbi:hypothetical protein FRC07_001549 [Ceratobasidium sp. 392]|nr:hypothetical protein FRC07_001549 [Ceratobasidium sp. 392]